MPEITLPPASLPAAAGPGPNSTSGEGASAATDTPFAAVLEGQIAAGAAIAATHPPQVLLNNNTGDATTNGAGNTHAVTESLPDLLALLGPQVLKPPAASNDDDQTARDIASALAISGAAPTEAATPVGIPATIVPPPAAVAHALDIPVETSRGSGTVASGSAILAAVSGAGARPAGENGSSKGADAALLVAAQEQQPLPRAEAATPHPAAVHVDSAPVTRLEAPVGSRQWDGEFANKLAWMVTRNEQRADLVLNPPQLGRVEVSISLTGDQAAATFTSANPVVREALEGAMPRLREVLLEAGISLGQTHVGSESPQQSPGGNENRDNQGRIMPLAGSGLDEGGGTGLATTAWLGGGRGMIDVFA